jgi:hypothetical protein
MNSLPSLDEQLSREAIIRWVIDRLTNRTNDLSTVGARAFVWKHALAREGQRGKLLTLAAKLKVSSARASVAVAEAEGAIVKVRTINTASYVEQR